MGEKTGERHMLKKIFQKNDRNGNRELDAQEFRSCIEV